MKISNVWNTVKNVVTVMSIVISITVLVFVLIIVTHKFSINIEQECMTTTTEDIPLTMPVTFQLNKAMTFTGDADVTMLKGTTLPVKIKMSIPLRMIDIGDPKQPVSVSLK